MVECLVAHGPYVVLGEVLKALEPYVTALISGFLTVAASVVAKRVYEVFGVKLSDAHWAVVHSAAFAAAGKIWASAEPSIATAKINASSPIVAAAAQGAIDVIPDVVKGIGITPAEMADLIVSKIGILQSAAAGGARGIVGAVPQPGTQM
jgi:hypothetical protein